MHTGTLRILAVAAAALASAGCFDPTCGAHLTVERVQLPGAFAALELRDAPSGGQVRLAPAAGLLVLDTTLDGAPLPDGAVAVSEAALAFDGPWPGQLVLRPGDHPFDLYATVEEAMPPDDLAGRTSGFLAALLGGDTVRPDSAGFWFKAADVDGPGGLVTYGHRVGALPSQVQDLFERAAPGGLTGDGNGSVQPAIVATEDGDWILQFSVGAKVLVRDGLEVAVDPFGNARIDHSGGKHGWTEAEAAGFLRDELAAAGLPEPQLAAGDVHVEEWCRRI